MDKIFTEFLLEAKKGTYADGTAKKVESSRKGSSDCNYQRGNMEYHDTYFGGKCFLGQEVVYIDGKAIWSMIYHGEGLAEDLAEEAFDSVLRPALSRVGEDPNVLPVRGPGRLEDNGFTYTFVTTGDLNSFNGTEEIYKGKTLVYRLVCSGGKIE